MFRIGELFSPRETYLASHSGLCVQPRCAPSNMELFGIPSAGPHRDHAVVLDSSVVAKLEAAAEKMMAHRSAEQAATDHRQNTGYLLKGPVPFGTFEMGRSSMPGNDNLTAVFMDGMARGLVHPHMNGMAQVTQGEYVPHTVAPNTNPTIL